MTIKHFFFYFQKATTASGVIITLSRKQCYCTFPKIMLWSHVVAQLVETLRYKPEGRGFSSRWWDCGPGVDWASNRYDYQEYFLGGKCGWFIGLTTFLPSLLTYLLTYSMEQSPS